MAKFIEAMIVAAAGSLIAGVIIAIKTLLTMSRDIKGFSPSLQALAAIQPLMIRATRHQNGALREIGANGATHKADECLDEAESVLNELLVKKIGGETK
ncbi:MAG: hypothetical protein KKB59_10575 [Spirochaetes bacterium]|nr:hypothetical protein [Spirochaetota bacterium]